MKQNIGRSDKIIRYLISLVFIALIITGVVDGSLAVVLGIAALILSATAAISFCGLYTLLGVTTQKQEKKEH